MTQQQQQHCPEIQFILYKIRGSLLHRVAQQF